MQNIAEALQQRAAESPQRVAMHFPIKVDQQSGYFPNIAYRDLSFAELELQSEQIALGLKAAGIQVGTRTVVMLKPSPEFFLSMFALFKLGAVPVLIDPGINKASLKACLQRAEPEAFIGVSLAHAARVVLGWSRASLRTLVTVGRRWFWSGFTWDEILQAGKAQPDRLQCFQDREALAAILFTSGSTGIPKGVEYRHRHFIAQIELLREAMAVKPGTVNMPTFPPFALFDPALGCTSVIPVMDPRRPGKADSRLLISALRQFQVQSMFGSPALLTTLVHFCEVNQVKLPMLKTVLSAGAPVAPHLIARAYPLLSEGARIFAPYGATEALPVAVLEGRKLLGERQKQSGSGAGICVGKPVQSVTIVPISDRVMLDLESAMPNNAIGEIVVQGGSVTDAYFAHPEATQLAKVWVGGDVAHRMGDLGYLAEDGMLWYCGRKSQRVQTESACLYTEQVEQYFNAHAPIACSALVGVQSGDSSRPVLIVQRKTGSQSSSDAAIIEATRKLAKLHPQCSLISDVLIYPRELPVDTRHNAKIQREQLAIWAAQNLRRT